MVVMSRVVLSNGGNLHRLPSTSWKTEIYRPEDLKLGCFSICLIFLTNIAPSLSLSFHLREMGFSKSVSLPWKGGEN